MRLFIAEKPSLARAIAANFGAQVQKTGYIEVSGNDVVAWCYGHMLESLKPEEYDTKWSSWSLDTLPIKVDAWRLKPRRDTEKQLSVLGELLKRATVVINAGDPDREGQLLVDEVLSHYGWHGKTLRLLLNAADRDSVTKAIASMRDNSEFRNLSEAALCRSKADWLVGMNLSRAATKKFGRDREVISVGRVQTPTLALVVRRDLEIQNFKSQAFYTLTADVKTAGGTVKMEHAPKEDRILDRKVAASLAASLKGKTVSLAVERKKSRELAPMPYMLATFQKDAEKHLGMGAQEALDTLQQLYEAQVTSYPRTDHEGLPPEQAGSAIKIASAVIGAGFVKEAKGLIPLMQPSKRIYSLPKDAEHHGLVPTGKKPGNLSAKLLKAYELVCRRFVLGLLPDYEFEETTASFVHEKRKFTCSGEVPLNAAKSWRALEPKKTAALALNGAPKEGVVLDVTVGTGKTTPPKPYTEATLIADMRSVAKFVTDPKLKAILKDTSGIGTAATQAGVIETLKKRNFIVVSKKKLVSTELGRNVVAKMPKAMVDPGVTAAWEDALSMIAAGKYKPEDFMMRTNLFVSNQLLKMGVGR